MLTELTETEWMVEPDDEDSREYARLYVAATNRGINIDGQTVIGWDKILAAYELIEKDEKRRGK
jgi:hypothetical protein